MAETISAVMSPVLVTRCGSEQSKYSASPTEKLSLNSYNMLNYLADGDLAGARVEARRFTVMRTYLEDYDDKHVYGTLGSYLAGFTMEKLGEASSAMRPCLPARCWRAFRTPSFSRPSWRRSRSPPASIQFTSQSYFLWEMRSGSLRRRTV